MACETASPANRLLVEIARSASDAAPAPVWAQKSELVPHINMITAEAYLESVLATDESLNVLHAYVPLMAMRIGAVRATLAVVSERLVYRDIDKTLALYIEGVLREPDATLASYQLLGPRALDSFTADFSTDPAAMVAALFGEASIKRHPELAEMVDFRQDAMERSGEGDETTPEIDETVGEAPDIGLPDPAVERDQQSQLARFSTTSSNTHASICLPSWLAVCGSTRSEARSRWPPSSLSRRLPARHWRHWCG